jgi:hypothetical protein
MLVTALDTDHIRVSVRRRGEADVRECSAHVRYWHLAAFRGNAAVCRFWGHSGQSWADRAGASLTALMTGRIDQREAGDYGI